MPESVEKQRFRGSLFDPETGQPLQFEEYSDSTQEKHSRFLLNVISKLVVRSGVTGVNPLGMLVNSCGVC